MIQTLPDAGWAALLRENANGLRALSAKVDLNASRVLFLQAEICDRSADRIDCLVHDLELAKETT